MIALMTLYVIYNAMTHCNLAKNLVFTLKIIPEKFVEIFKHLGDYLAISSFFSQHNCPNDS